MMRLPLLSVVIPTYGDAGVSLTATCLDSIIKEHGHMRDDVEITVVSDNDGEETLSRLQGVCQERRVGLVWLDKRSGFSAAVNAGMERSNGMVVFLVNNDVYFVEPTLQYLLDFSMFTGAGIVGCRLLYPNDTVQFGGTVFVPLQDPEKKKEIGIPGFFDHFCRNKPALDIGATQCRESLLTGALFGVSRWAIDTIGLMDSRFPFSCEDVDYCLRSIDAGRVPMYCGYTKAYHMEGATRGNTPESKAEKAPDIALKEMESLKRLFNIWNGIDWMKFAA